MSIYEKIQKLDVRIIYLLMLLSVAIPLIWPVGLPISVSTDSELFFEAVERIPPGEILMIDAAYSPSSAPELFPATLALARHAFSRDVRIVGYNQWDLGAQLVMDALDQAAAEYNKTYGVDYVVLGYKIPLLPMIRAAVTDTWGAWKADINGTSFDQLPMMQDLRSYREDLYMIACMATGSPGAESWITWVSTPSLAQPNNPDGFVRYIEVIVACTSVSIPGYKNDLQAGLITGLLAGGRGSAEYELLIRQPGEGIKLMDAQSMAHLMIIFFIVLGNVGYFGSRRR